LIKGSAGLPRQLTAVTILWKRACETEVPNADAQAFNAVSSAVIGSKVKGQVSHSTHEPPALYFTPMHLRASSEHVQAAGPALPECSAAKHEGGV